MSDIMWFLTRSTGIVALVLIVAAVGDGLLFSGRNTGRRIRPAWWLNLHRGLGGMAMAFTGLHMLTSFLSSDLGLSWTALFVPGGSDWATGAFTLGVLAFYGMAITVFTTWPKRRFRRKVWHALHLLSIPAAVLAVVHAYQLGTDATNPRALVLMTALIGLASYPLWLRLATLGRRPTRTVRPTAAPTPTATPDRELVGAGR